MASFKHLLAATVLAAAGTAAGTAAASAAPYCPTNESLFGTVQRVNGSNITLQTTSGHWATVMLESGAKVNANGYSIRPGIYAGAYGCVTPNGVFHANEFTLASSASKYNETLTGVVRRMETGKLIVAQNGRGYGTWYVPDIDEFQVGQTVTGTGMVGSSGLFYPQTVNGRSVAYDTDTNAAPTTSTTSGTVTLSGVIQHVGTNTLAVWQPTTHHTGKWVVRDAGHRYRVGERVMATGTEDRHGTFYPNSITIQ